MLRAKSLSGWSGRQLHRLSGAAGELWHGPADPHTVVGRALWGQGSSGQGGPGDTRPSSPAKAKQRGGESSLFTSFSGESLFPCPPRAAAETGAGGAVPAAPPTDFPCFFPLQMMDKPSMGQRSVSREGQVSPRSLRLHETLKAQSYLAVSVVSPLVKQREMW